MMEVRTTRSHQRDVLYRESIAMTSDYQLKEYRYSSWRHEKFGFPRKVRGSFSLTFFWKSLSMIGCSVSRWQRQRSETPGAPADSEVNQAGQQWKGSNYFSDGYGSQSGVLSGDFVPADDAFFQECK